MTTKPACADRRGTAPPRRSPALWGWAGLSFPFKERVSPGPDLLAGCLDLGETDGVNFLAHLVLAPQTPEGLIGSIAPDMIRGPLPAQLHESVLAAAREHQSIDGFTDAHRAFGRTRDRLRPLVHPRLSGVLADVLYDHVLARDWGHWRGDDLEAFVADTQRGLTGALHLVPAGMQWVVRKMIDEEWLLSYATVEGLCARLETMSRRLTRRMGRPISLVLSEGDLGAVEASLSADFADLWPDLLAHVSRYRLQERGRLAS